MTPPEREFGQHLRELRLKKQLTQRQLAEKANIDFTYLSKVENGRMPAPSKKVIEVLAKILGASGDELLLLAEKVPPAMEKEITTRGAVADFLRSAIDEPDDYFRQQLEELQRRRTRKKRE